MVSRFMQKPKVSHLASTKRILKYLIETIDYGILFLSADEGKECKLVGYTNSSLCSDAEDRKSTAGYVFMLDGAPIGWSLKKDPVVTLSSCEAEYIVVSLCACQATWVMNLVEEITIKDHGAISTKVDNMSSINLANNPIAHGRSKHIRMRFCYLREQVADEKPNLKH
ncbi:secreted RxLR effector protein 161-like [Vicia villosa]|uniref:secreted RxLR effector protein 161-like n=1 Tax=Vicia villosa TaxID=3911 RepID=UPI00273B608B|nr:secreted RxLR effector protein 161-like [Vicia villosa]